MVIVGLGLASIVWVFFTWLGVRRLQASWRQKRARRRTADHDSAETLASNDQLVQRLFVLWQGFREAFSVLIFRLCVDATTS
jgi:hypothetical protein